jgi:hypothetical protein
MTKTPTSSTKETIGHTPDMMNDITSLRSDKLTYELQKKKVKPNRLRVKLGPLPIQEI